ncbi:MAG TPA: hypothetical protein VK171_14705 [Fimbriimonas sp.]|nr:hypothetical protein [Fimbriimonas sp.]
MMTHNETNLRASDIVFLAVADLQRSGFESVTIAQALEHIEKMNFGDSKDIGTLRTHLSSHSLANKPARPNKTCMLFALGGGRVRLLNPNDAIDPSKNPREKFPQLDRIPPEFRELVNWAIERFEAAGGQTKKVGLEALLNLEGKFRYTSEGQSVADYVRELRSDWE